MSVLSPKRQFRQICGVQILWLSGFNNNKMYNSARVKVDFSEKCNASLRSHFQHTTGLTVSRFCNKDRGIATYACPETKRTDPTHTHSHTHTHTHTRTQSNARLESVLRNRPSVCLQSALDLFLYDLRVSGLPQTLLFS